VSTNLDSIARHSLAPNIRDAEKRLERFGGREAKPVILKAKQGLQRVLSQPDVLLNKNISELRRAFSRAQFLAIRRGFSQPNCRYP